MSNFTWDDASETRLKELWREGWGATSISQALTREFHGVLSRNAVIGKLHRLGLTARRDPSRPRKPYWRPNMDPQRFTKGGHVAIHPQKSRVPKPQQPEPPKPIEPDPCAPTNPPVYFWDLQARHCRWPRGELHKTSYWYCGAPADFPDQPYCEYHAAMSRRQSSSEADGRFTARDWAA